MNEHIRILQLVDQTKPRVLPAGWRETEHYQNAAVFRGPERLAVIWEVAFYDARPWLHVSVSTPDALPTWEQLREVKDLFCGKHALALQVLPPESEYVNAHPYVLHLWVVLAGTRPVPDFRRDGLI